MRPGARPVNSCLYPPGLAPVLPCGDIKKSYRSWCYVIVLSDRWALTTDSMRYCTDVASAADNTVQRRCKSLKMRRKNTWHGGCIRVTAKRTDGATFRRQRSAESEPASRDAPGIQALRRRACASATVPTQAPLALVWIPLVTAPPPGRDFQTSVLTPRLPGGAFFCLSQCSGTDHLGAREGCFGVLPLGRG